MGFISLPFIECPHTAPNEPGCVRMAKWSHLNVENPRHPHENACRLLLKFSKDRPLSIERKKIERKKNVTNDPCHLSLPPFHQKIPLSPFFRTCFSMHRHPFTPLFMHAECTLLCIAHPVVHIPQFTSYLTSHSSQWCTVCTVMFQFDARFSHLASVTGHLVHPLAHPKICCISCHSRVLSCHVDHMRSFSIAHVHHGLNPLKAPLSGVATSECTITLCKTQNIFTWFPWLML